MVFKNLRKYTKTIMWVIAIFIVPAFVIWNIGSAVSKRRSGFAGKIFNKKISWKEYVTEKRAARNDAWLKYGDELEQSVDIDEQTWTRLILLHEAKKRKIKVSNAELLEHIKQLPLFQFAKLDSKNYPAIIANVFRQTPHEFENGVRNSLVIAKLMEQLTSNVTLTDAELKTAYIKEFEQAAVSYITITPENFTDLVNVDDEEKLKEYYEKNKENFKTPEQVSVEYIEVKLEKFKDAITIDEERVKKYYEENKDEFALDEETEEENENNETQYKNYDDVKSEIKDKLTEKEMVDRASDLSRRLINKLYADVPLGDVAAEFGLDAKKTGPFSMFEEIPGVGLSFPFLKAAFSLKVGEVSEIIKTPTAYYILKPIKKIAPAVPPYEDVADKIKQVYREAEAKKLARQKGTQIREQLVELINSKKINFEKAAAELGFEVKKAENVTRSGYIAELGFAQEFTQTAFTLNPEEISGLVNTPRGFCIVKLERIISVDEEKFEEEKESYREKAISAKRNTYLNNWFEKIKQQANPVSYLQENQLQ